MQYLQRALCPACLIAFTETKNGFLILNALYIVSFSSKLVYLYVLCQVLALKLDNTICPKC